MKRWSTLWSGHVFLAVALICAYWFCYFGFECVKSLDGEAMLRYFLYAMAMVMPAVASGILAATRFRTKRQRYYITHEGGMAADLYAPTGGHRKNR